MIFFQNITKVVCKANHQVLVKYPETELQRQHVWMRMLSVRPTDQVQRNNPVSVSGYQILVLLFIEDIYFNLFSNGVKSGFSFHSNVMLIFYFILSNGSMQNWVVVLTFMSSVLFSYSQ